MNENKLKHIELIQDVIKRMSDHSFLLKGWAITLIVATFAFLKDGYDICFLNIVLMLPVLMFWCLDGYYLYQERLYKGLYKDVIGREPSKIDFSMEAYRYHDGDKNNQMSAIFSRTLVLFYAPLLVLTFVLF